MKRITEPTYTPREIVVRQDSDESTTIEKHAAFFYPVIMLNNTVLNMTDIRSFSMSYGEKFLPRCVFTFDNSEIGFTETDWNESERMLCTIRIANNFDKNNTPVKADYLVKRISGKVKITVTCELFVPKLHERVNRVFEGTSRDVMEQLATECGFGLFTNIDQTEDSTTWIQTGTTIEFMKELASRAFTTLSDAVCCYIDPKLSLNFVSIQNALSNTTDIQVLTDAYTGETLETPVPLVLSNDYMVNEDSPRTAKMEYVEIGSKFGLRDTKTPNMVNVSISDGTSITEAKTIQYEAIQGGVSFIESDLDEDYTHRNILIAPETNRLNREMLLDNTNQLVCGLEYHEPHIHCFANVTVELYKKGTGVVETQEQITQEQALEDAEQVASNTYVRDEQNSGRYVIKSIEYVFKPSQTLRPILKLTKVI